MSAAGLRASDADRQRAVAELQRHTADGRLTLDEYTERVDRAFAARTTVELAALLRDLPTGPPPVPAAGPQLGVAFLLAAVALIVIGALVLLGR